MPAEALLHPRTQDNCMPATRPVQGRLKLLMHPFTCGNHCMGAMNSLTLQRAQPLPHSSTSPESMPAP